MKVATSLRDGAPGCRVPSVTGHGRPGHLKRALVAGVRGFVPRPSVPGGPPRSPAPRNSGNRYVEPELAADAISARDSPPAARAAEVPAPAADGAPAAEIAVRAALSPGTVRNHLSSAVAEPGAETRHAAVCPARERGWV